ncbi:MAG: ATP-binding protein [Bacillota bacterium]
MSDRLAKAMENRWFRYGVAIVAVGLATLFRASVDRFWGDTSPYIFFYAAIMLAVVFGGRGPAALATILGGVIGAVFFVAPRGHLNLDQPAEAIRLGTFLSIGLFMSYLGGGLRANRLRRQAEEALQQAKAELEHRVAERTAELRSAHLALLEKSRYVEAFFQHSITPLVFLTRDFDFIRVNEAYARAGKRPVSDFPGHNHFAFYPHAENEAIFRDVVRNKKPYFAMGKPFEYADHPEWGVTYWDWTLVPILDESGEVDFLVFSLEDVTTRRRAEIELEKQNQRLEEMVRQRTADLETARAAAEQANRAKDHFLAVLSHELRTPLAPVVMMTSLLANRRDLPDDVQRDLQAIQRSAQLEARLIDDLLDLTKIAKGKMRFDFQTVDADLVIRTAGTICGQGTGARIVLDLQAKHHWVRGDAARLQQVFWNFLNNTRKFTPADGSITVHSTNTETGRLHIEVTDTGVGIDPAVLPRLFNAFEQGDADGKRLGGLGLGLAISKAIVESHGGMISGRSEGRGKGATFCVELATVPDPVAEENVSPPAAQMPHPVSERLLRILLVEDHESTRKIMQRLIAGLGHRVQAAASVEAAKTAATRERFDLVISDLGLPDGSGHELMGWLKERYGLTGIALSGYGMEEDIQKSRKAGFVEHLTKPVNLEQFEAAISRVMGDGGNSEAGAD